MVMGIVIGLLVGCIIGIFLASLHVGTKSSDVPQDRYAYYLSEHHLKKA